MAAKLSESWKISVFGAVAALLGALIGAGASVLINQSNLHHDDDERARNERKAAYVSFMTAAQEQRDSLELVFTQDLRAQATGEADDFIAYLSRRGERLIAGITDVNAELATLRIYSDGRVYDDASRVQRRLLRSYGLASEIFLQTGHSGSALKASTELTNSLSDVDDALADYALAVRDDLDNPAP